MSEHSLEGRIIKVETRLDYAENQYTTIDSEIRTQGKDVQVLKEQTKSIVGTVNDMKVKIDGIHEHLLRNSVESGKTSEFKSWSGKAMWLILGAGITLLVGLLRQLAGI